MSVVNFRGPGLVIPRPKRARSQLATNRFLIDLGRVHGKRSFTSRDVSNRFGLDFLNTCKALSRMSKRPYYLLSAVRVPRPYGGYENSYTISRRGWPDKLLEEGICNAQPHEPPRGILQLQLRLDTDRTVWKVLASNGVGIRIRENLGQCNQGKGC